MYRIEIISNLSLELDLKESFFEIETEFSTHIYYTKINNVHGKGKKGEKQGDSVWPEENFIMIIYTEDIRIVNKLKDVIEKINNTYVTEGVKIFVLEGSK